LKKNPKQLADLRVFLAPLEFSEESCANTAKRCGIGLSQAICLAFGPYAPSHVLSG